MNDYGNHVAWCGGEPLPNWSGLKEPNPTTIQAGQKRPTYHSDETKAQKYRREGLKTKFSKDHDLQLFQQDVLDHLEDTGMNTISYLPDPGDAQKMICVITDHGRFNLKHQASSEAANQTAQDAEGNNSNADQVNLD